MSIREDHRRFREIIKGRIKQHFKKYVTQSEMIGRQENELVKIPVPSIEIPKFRYGPKDQSGVGQGQGQPGDAVQGQKGEGNGQAGESPGQHMLEVDVSLEELADILGEELSLPRIQAKGNKTIQTTHTKYTGRSPVGPNSLRLFKHSYKEALKRQIVEGNYNPDDPMVVPIREDLRFRTMKKVTKPQANAVVIYMMDVSGSMGDEQKEIVRLESFWINTWLRRNYRGLETRFIIHDAAAREVDEKTFFSTSESGGTLISSAYKLAKKMIDDDYPINAWNIYPFHFSDGDNWSGEDTRVCLSLLKDFFLPNVNMFGYGQVESKYGSGQFLKDLDKAFHEDERITMSKIENRDKIMASIKEFLGKGR
jgi:sporulation protein YhbH